MTATEMPDVDGEALATRVLALRPEARVLFLGNGSVDRLEGPMLGPDSLPGLFAETVDALLEEELSGEPEG